MSVKGVDLTLMLLRDCRERKRRVIQTLTYNRSGEISLVTKPNAAWGAVAADSKSMAFFESACGK